MTDPLSVALQLLSAILEDGLWAPIDKYCELTGETYEAVATRRSKGIWKDGVHSKFVKGSGLWVNLLETNRWVAKSALRPACRSGRRKKGQPSESLSSTAAGSAENPSD